MSGVIDDNSRSFRPRATYNVGDTPEKIAISPARSKRHGRGDASAACGQAAGLRAVHRPPVAADAASDQAHRHRHGRPDAAGGVPGRPVLRGAGRSPHRDALLAALVDLLGRVVGGVDLRRDPAGAPLPLAGQRAVRRQDDRGRRSRVQEQPDQLPRAEAVSRAAPQGRAGDARVAGRQRPDAGGRRGGGQPAPADADDLRALGGDRRVLRLRRRLPPQPARLGPPRLPRRRRPAHEHAPGEHQAGR